MLMQRYRFQSRAVLFETLLWWLYIVHFQKWQMVGRGYVTFFVLYLGFELNAKISPLSQIILLETSEWGEKSTGETARVNEIATCFVKNVYK